MTHARSLPSDMITDALDVNSIATEVISALAGRRQTIPFSRSHRRFGISDSYRVTPLLRAAFEARGEKIIGRKIGFTNREMWVAHGVQAPIWGYCTDHTTFELSDTPVQCVGAFVEPRIEPEIIFGLRSAPSPDMDEMALLDCIDWVALGYEVVQSIYPRWQFSAADTVAANALHGALLIGNRRAIVTSKEAWRHALATFSIELLCDGRLIQNGGGALVLGSPILALRHLVGLLADDRHNPALTAGEVVSTGTLTLAMPVSAGETWTTKVRSLPLDDVTLRFEA